MTEAFKYVFPAIKGIQAKREYYVAMCPLRLVPRLFVFNEEELPPELRSQRALSKTRIPEISHYVISNRDNYTFSALTASIDSDITFEKMSNESKLGNLHIPMDARIVINDGQHRRAAIEQALKDIPELGDETIAVVLFQDRGLERCQQMFADLNRYAIRPANSLNILYDHRDDLSLLTKNLITKLPIFTGFVELERSTLAARSRKLFTLSAIHTSTKALFGSSRDIVSQDDKMQKATDFWTEIDKQITDWRRVRKGTLNASELRRDLLHTHGVVLEALGYVGHALLKQSHGSNWMMPLKKLKKINWSRHDHLWQGRAVIGGKVSKAKSNVILTTNAIKQYLGLSLTTEESQAEEAFQRGNR